VRQQRAPESGRSHHWVDPFSEGKNGRSDRESWVVAMARWVCMAKKTPPAVSKMTATTTVRVQRRPRRGCCRALRI
jgi:hypothetical protein